MRLPVPNLYIYCNFLSFSCPVDLIRIFQAAQDYTMVFVTVEITLDLVGTAQHFPLFLCLSRGISTASFLSSSGMTPPSSSTTLSQPIIISDTPSPAVSIITIHSDTDTEDERKFHPARWGQDTPLYSFSVLFFLWAGNAKGPIYFILYMLDTTVPVQYFWFKIYPTSWNYTTLPWLLEDQKETELVYSFRLNYFWYTVLISLRNNTVSLFTQRWSEPAY